MNFRTWLNEVTRIDKKSNGIDFPYQYHSPKSLFGKFGKGAEEEIEYNPAPISKSNKTQISVKTKKQLSREKTVNNFKDVLNTWRAEGKPEKNNDDEFSNYSYDDDELRRKYNLIAASPIYDRKTNKIIFGSFQSKLVRSPYKIATKNMTLQQKEGFINQIFNELLKIKKRSDPQWEGSPDEQQLINNFHHGKTRNSDYRKTPLDPVESR